MEESKIERENEGDGRVRIFRLDIDYVISMSVSVRLLSSVLLLLAGGLYGEGGT